MNEENGQKSIVTVVRQYGNLFLRWSWLIILISLLTGGFSYFSSSQQTPMYRTSATVQLKKGSSTVNPDFYSNTFYLQQLNDTYSRMMTSRSILDPLSDLVGYKISSGMVRVTPVTNTELMTITVTDSNPTRAALIANNIIGVFTKEIQNQQTEYYGEALKAINDQLVEIDQKVQDFTNALANEMALEGTVSEDKVKKSQLQTNLNYFQQQYYVLSQSAQQIKFNELTSKFNLDLIDPAPVPGAPFMPNPIQDGTLGLIVGFIIAASIVFLIEFFDDSIHDPQEITNRYGIPIFGLISKYELPREQKLITTFQPRSPVSEGFRVLRTNLQFASVDHPVNNLLITSCLPEEGKTSIASNLAVVIAQSNKSVLLVDCDLHRPQIHYYLQQSNRMGLADYFLQTKEDRDSIIKKLELENLNVITSGSLPPNPTELIGSEKMVRLLKDLKGKYDYVIVDSPPILAIPDGLELAARMDGVLMVVKPTITKWNELMIGIERLKKVNAKIIGIVFNDVKMNRSNVYYRRYSMGKEYGKEYYKTNDK